MGKAKVFDVYGTGMTRNEIASEKVRPGLFTGKWHGVHYYRGVKWVGPTNLLGFGVLAHIEIDRRTCITNTTVPEGFSATGAHVSVES